jgi:hypothetical protein
VRRDLVMRYPVLILLLALAELSAAGGGKPRITVRLQVDERDCLQYFLDNELQAIESQSAIQISSALSECFGCVQFTNEHNPDTLVILVSNREPMDTTSQLREVGFRMRLVGPHTLPSAEPLYWVFRPKERNLPLSTAEAFQRDVALEFARQLEIQKPDFVKRLLGRFVIADTAMAFRQELRWVIPLKKEEIAVEDMSEFLINCEFVDQTGTFKRPYETQAIGAYPPPNVQPDPRFGEGILTEIVEGEKHVDDVRSNKRMKILGVCLTKYVPIVSPDLPVTPDSARVGNR